MGQFLGANFFFKEIQSQTKTLKNRENNVQFTHYNNTILNI
jgi:hypothetical protein